MHWLRRAHNLCTSNLLSTGIIIISLIASKSVSGFLGGRIIGFNTRTSWGMGVITIAQMSTTLATASLAFQYGILDENIVAALVLLSVITIHNHSSIDKANLWICKRGNQQIFPIMAWKQSIVNPQH